LVHAMAALPLSGFTLTSPSVELLGDAISIDLVGTDGVAQTLARQTTLTTMRASARLTALVDLSGSTDTLNAFLYKGDVDGPLVKTTLGCTLTPVLPGPIAAGTVFECAANGNVVIQPGELAVWVLDVDAPGALALAAVSQATISAG
jgi:hypothetical protein